MLYIKFMKLIRQRQIYFIETSLLILIRIWLKELRRLKCLKVRNQHGRRARHCLPHTACRICSEINPRCIDMPEVPFKIDLTSIISLANFDM